MSAERDDDEATLFREAMRGVRRSAPAPRALLKRRAPAPRAHFTRADAADVLQQSLAPMPADLELETGEELVFRRAGVQDTVLRNLRRGHYRVEDALDLHGLNLEQAKAALREFLAESLGRGRRCVRIVHGKGLRSGQRGPVLKSAVNSILRRTAPVLAFVSARRVDGGTGAVYVLLGAARR
ncbi:MAG TPA: Smr/MutS family protein [Steroidobacteraceae bacterium]